MSPTVGPVEPGADDDLAVDDAEPGAGAGRADVVIVPPDDETAGRLPLAAGESLTPEALEAFTEGAPPAAEELVHEESSLQEVLLDEGEPFEPPSDDDVEAAWASLNDSETSGLDDGVTTALESAPGRAGRQRRPGKENDRWHRGGTNIRSRPPRTV